ncbi:MAG: NusG domain II-containing protein [Bacteroidota bacterium]|nr:NusG domain II-containing protein [Bacteroidota bacterium]
MISRRSFLKLTGLAAGALGAGFGTGRMLTADSGRRFAMHGFVPDDERTVADLLRLFHAELPSGAGVPVIDADARWHRVLRGASGSPTFSAGPRSGSGRVVVRMQRLGSAVAGDVLVTDDRKRMYHPDGDFSMALRTLRGRLQSAEAEYMFSAEYVEEAPFAALLSSGSMLVVEDVRGIVDRIRLDDGGSRSFEVDGPQGRTGVTVRNGSAHVHKASCRHALCRKAGFASRPGEVIACAPNRVLLRIERA